MLDQEAAHERYRDHVATCEQCKTADAAFADDGNDEQLLRSQCAEGGALQLACDTAADAWESWPRDFLAHQHPQLLSLDPAQHPFEVDPWLADIVPGPALMDLGLPATPTPRRFAPWETRRSAAVR
jgi:hypothetical protein